MARRLTAYDAAYLELAQRTGLPLATLDGDLQRAAQAEGVTLVEEKHERPANQHGESFIPVANVQRSLSMSFHQKICVSASSQGAPVSVSAFICVYQRPMIPAERFGCLDSNIRAADERR